MAIDIMQDIEREMARQKQTERSATPHLDVISDTLRYAEEDAGRKEREYAREIAVVNAFEAKIDRQIENTTRSGNIYSDAEIEDLRESIKSTYNTDSDRFSSLRSEFTDSYEARLDSLSEFSRMNKEWNNLENQVPVAQNNLLKLTEDLTGTEWDDLSQENKLAFKDRLMDQTQKVADLKRVLKNPYNQPRKNYSQIGSNISGIGNGKLALLTQLSTFDPGKVVITEGEMQAMTQAIQNDDPSLISAINNEGLKRKVERANMMESSIAKNVKEYDKLVAFYSTPEYTNMVKRKGEEEAELIKKGEIIPDDFWMDYMADGTEINLLDQVNELRKREDDANDIDESYRRENLMGASYKESFDVDFPWDVEPTVGDEEGGGTGGLEVLEEDEVSTELDEVPKLDKKSFDNIVDYASKLDTKEAIHKTLLDNKVPNYPGLTRIIIRLKNIEKKYGKDSKEYKKTYNKSKKWFDVLSFIPYYDESIPEKDIKHKERLKRRKAGAIR
jgi:hypothetical protein